MRNGEQRSPQEESREDECARLWARENARREDRANLDRQADAE